MPTGLEIRVAEEVDGPRFVLFGFFYVIECCLGWYRGDYGGCRVSKYSRRSIIPSRSSSFASSTAFFTAGLAGRVVREQKVQGQGGKTFAEIIADLCRLRKYR